MTVAVAYYGVVLTLSCDLHGCRSSAYFDGAAPINAHRAAEKAGWVFASHKVFCTVEHKQEHMRERRKEGNRKGLRKRKATFK